MAGWPTTPVPTTNLDAGTDSPAAARSDLLTCAQNVNTMKDGRGAADGVAPLDSNQLVPLANLPVTPFMTGRFRDGTPAGTVTWTVPAGVTRVLVRLVGAGGGGGYTSTGTGGDHGGGGGGGGYAEKLFTVVPGSNFTYEVGAGGAGGATTGDTLGGDGDDSYCTSPASATPATYTVTGAGGLGGIGGGTRFGGGGGAPSNGDVLIEGGAGTSGTARGGPGGVSGCGGPPNAGTNPLIGAGGGGFGSGNGTAGFPGKHGFVEFIW